mgnify:CR=1 FL=1
MSKQTRNPKEEDAIIVDLEREEEQKENQEADTERQYSDE